MIDNSSIAWISNLNKSILSMLSKERRTTISQLREYIENDGKINEDAIIYASSIGINIGKKPKLTTEKAQLEARSQELDVELSVVMEQLNSMGKGVSNGQSRKY